MPCSLNVISLHQHGSLQLLISIYDRQIYCQFSEQQS